jgi:hypothetical protein
MKIFRTVALRGDNCKSTVWNRRMEIIHIMLEVLLSQ